MYLCGACSRPWYVCEVVLIPYVDAAVAVTVMRDGNAGVVDGGGVVVASAGHVGGTRGSVIVSCADDVLGVRVVRGMRGVSGLCEMCMCLARGGVGG